MKLLQCYETQKCVVLVSDIQKILAHRGPLYICLKINSQYCVKVIQVYAPTSTHDNKEVETLYEDVEKVLEENRTHYQYIVGDFNAKLGKREEESEVSIGSFSYD